MINNKGVGSLTNTHTHHWSVLTKKTLTDISYSQIKDNETTAFTSHNDHLYVKYKARMSRALCPYTDNIHM